MPTQAEIFLQKHLNAGLEETLQNGYKPTLPPIVCGAATLMSVQASKRHQSMPCQDFGVFEEVQVMFFKGKAPYAWIDYMNGDGDYSYVPVAEVARFLDICQQYATTNPTQAEIAAAWNADPRDAFGANLCIDTRRGIELTQAGLPSPYVGAVETATGRFWLEISRLFPEVTSGDSQLTDEPGNAIALWIAESTGSVLDETRLNWCRYLLKPGVDPERVDAALNQALLATQRYLEQVLTDLQPASARVRAMLHMAVCDFLHWNHPSAAEID